MESYRYTWKIGPEYFCNRELETNKPLAEGSIFADLYDGRRYKVSHVFAAQPMDRFADQMSDTVIQTWLAGTLTEQELEELRGRAAYVRSEYSRRYDAVAF